MNVIPIQGWIGVAYVEPLEVEYVKKVVDKSRIVSSQVLAPQSCIVWPVVGISEVNRA